MINTNNHKKHPHLKLNVISDNYEDKFKPYCIKLRDENIEKIFYSWFDNFKKLRGAYELYYSIEEYTLPAPTLLTTYTQVLESYHKQKYNKEKGTFKDRITQICNDLKQYELFKEIISPYNINQIEKYVECINLNRNYYTHYDKNKKDSALKGRELIKLNHSLKRLIELLFLKELKFDPNEINKITTTMTKFGNLTFLGESEEKEKNENIN